MSPGYFYNASTIQANAGNSIAINIGASSEMFNSGSVIANGGTVRILVSPSSIPGGYAGVFGFAVIQAGGTLETQASYPLVNGALPGGTGPRYAFLDTTPGNTLKIDNLGAFGGAVFGFQAGDTVDLGASLAIGTIDYSPITGLLTLEAVGGAILGELYLSANGMTSGATAVSGGIANGITVGSIVVNGTTDTVLTTNRIFPSASNISGIWQSATSWTNGVIPGATDTALIGAVATAGTPVGNFTLNTGVAAVSVSGITLIDPHATLLITSNTTATPGVANVFAGKLQVSSGSTLTSSFLRMFGPLATAAIDAGGTISLTGRPATSFAATAGTVAIAQGNSSAVQIAAGTLTVNGALLAGPPSPAGGGGNISIGSDSSGLPATVTVNGDGIAGHGTVTVTRTLLGSGPTSAGSLIVSGPGATWTDTIDKADPLNTRGNMTVGFNDLSSNTPAGLAQPPMAMAANVLVQNGATLTEQGTGATLGNNINTAGNVTIATGGFWNLAANGVGGGIGVGRLGSGVLSVISGGSVAIGANGTFLSNGTTAIFGGIGVGQTAGATGTILVSGANSGISLLAGMSVGQGGQGLLSILNGGTIVENIGGISVGTSLTGSSSGTIVVGGSGAAAALNLAAASGTIAAAGGLTIGSVSNGTVTVADNGSINVNGTGFVTVGSGTGSIGTLVVGGTTAAAALRIATTGLTVGNQGTGVASVNTLGTIALTGTSGIVIGQSAGGAGTMTVANGTVTESATASGLFVGVTSGAVGTLSISNAGTVSLAGGGLFAGSNSGGSGTVAISGAGALLTTSGTAGVSVGSSGAGVLTIGSGGSLGVGTGGTVAGSGGLFIGSFAGAIGSVSVAGGTLSASTGGSGINVGAGGAGTLAVSAGGTVADAGALTIGSSSSGAGLVTLNSGTISASAITVGSFGSGTVTVSTGVIGIAGGLFAGSNSGSSGTISVTGSASALTVGNGMQIGNIGVGTLSVQNTAVATTNTLSLGGSFFSPQSTLSSRASIGTGGHLAVTGAMAIWAGSTVFIDGASGSGIDIGTSGTFVSGAINVENGHSIVGSGLIAAAVVNNGLILGSSLTAPAVFQAGTLEIQGSITGTGILQMGANSLMRLDTLPAVTQTIQFGTGSELILAAPGASLPNAITGLSAGDKIEFNFGTGVNISSAAFNGAGTVTVNTTAGSYQLTNVSFAAGSAQTFSIATDSASGLGFIQVQCFAAGTRIATDRGPVAVEHLALNDRIALAEGGFAPAVWIGRRTVDCARHPRPESVWPVRVRAGAFGLGAPDRDLFLSPDHAVFVDGVLVPVRLLIDGGSIAQIRRRTVEYFHVELPEHAVILAEGLTVESYLDTGDKADFEGGAVSRLFPAFGAASTAALWETMGAAPLVQQGAALERAQAAVAGTRKAWRRTA